MINFDEVTKENIIHIGLKTDSRFNLINKQPVIDKFICKLKIHTKQNISFN